MKPKKEKDEEFGRRLKLFRTNVTGLNQTNFALKIGLTEEQQANVSFWEKGTKPQDIEVYEGIYRAYPDLNKDWLLYGTGDMLINKAASGVVRSDKTIEELVLQNKKLIEIVERLSLLLNPGNFLQDSRQLVPENIYPLWSTIKMAVND